MSLTDRDRKIIMVIAPVLLLVAYWFLVFSPKREEAAQLGDALAEVEEQRDQANQRAALLENAKATYANDYETVVRVGKAIPSSLDMPSLIVQLDQAAKGTGIRFKRVKTGDRTTAPPPPTPAPPADGAQSAPGQARDAAQGAAATSDTRSEASGAVPPAGAPADAGATGTTSGVPGLESVPLEFSFSGSFFDLADFFHRMKRFVRVANERVAVDGRLMTIDGFTFESTEFPTLETDATATVYLAPKSEGTTAGATPAGPSPVTQQASGTPPTSTETTPPPAQPAGTPAPASAGAAR